MTRLDSDTHLRCVGGATSIQKADIGAKETPHENRRAPVTPHRTVARMPALPGHAFSAGPAQRQRLPLQ